MVFLASLSDENGMDSSNGRCPLIKGFYEFEKTKPSRSLTGIRVLKLLLTFFVESVSRIKSLVLVLMTSGSLKIVQTTASTHSGVVKLPSYLKSKIRVPRPVDLLVRHETKIPTGNNFESCHEQDQTWKMIFDQHYFQNHNLEMLFG